MTPLARKEGEEERKETLFTNRTSLFPINIFIAPPKPIKTKNMKTKYFIIFTILINLIDEATEAIKQIDAINEELRQSIKKKSTIEIQ
jgi:hypothetical protein